MQQSFITNNQVRPDLTLFNSQDSKAVYGNLLTLPIGGSGLLYVEPLYVQGTGQNSFPLLQKVLVNYGDRVGYADTLQGALDQVFGPGAGESATGGGAAPSTGGATPSTGQRRADDESAGRWRGAPVEPGPGPGGLRHPVRPPGPEVGAEQRGLRRAGARRSPTCRAP